jgi:bile acid-coenzyme A ligase
VSALPYGSRISQLARDEPNRIALVCEGEAWTRLELDSRANRLARCLAERGLEQGQLASILLPNGLELMAAMAAVWKLGAIPNPLSHRLPETELRAILERAEPGIVIGREAGVDASTPCLPTGFVPDDGIPDDPLPERLPPHERALASGGSTGTPKLIIAATPALHDPATASPLFVAREAALVPGPIYHAAPFSAAWQGVLAGCKVVVMPRFDARNCLALIAEHRIDRMNVVPTMMQRIWRLPREEREGHDVSSLTFVMTGGAPCSAWLMRAWIDWLGPDVMHEAFGPSERIGGTFITGREWLAHPGSVGRMLSSGEIRIQDDAGTELPPGEMGEIFMRPAGGQGSTYRYVGANARATADGFESVGDMGYLDAEGYLFLGDRKSDMILCAGRNIYPAEVEAAIDAHTEVGSSAVIGLPNEDLGQSVHAIVEVRQDVSEADLRAHLAERLLGYKIPRSFEFVSEPLRDDAGKLRRSALRSARVG